MLIKRFLDIFLSFSALILLAPVLLIISFIIKISSSGPIIFKQERIGKNERPFKLYKFRTMVKGADKLKKNIQDKNQLKGPAFKLKNDPRITLIGKILRKTSLDEVPQFFNILKGDMSLVGPRPMLKSEVKKLKPWMKQRFSINPGLTCIWQVAGRNKIKTFEYWMKMDIDYVKHHHLLLDLKILFLTVPVVLFGYGAE